MIATEAAAALAERSAVAVDVREPQEWAAGRIEGSLWIPLGELPARLDELPPGRLLLVCAHGIRSAAAAEALAGLGYPTENLDGGLAAWTHAGLPLTRA